MIAAMNPKLKAIYDKRLSELSIGSKQEPTY
jgi:hypothetical protein